MAKQTSQQVDPSKVVNSFCLNESYSTTRHVTREIPVIQNNPDDKFETVLFLSEGEGRQGAGGLRTNDYFKRSLEDKPLITVVTVVYNGEQYLEETILSVINQTYHNVEYIIVDGGSTDGTLDIIRKYEHAIDYWVSEKDKGIYDAMNKGIVLAVGEWINFMNAGDNFFNEKVVSTVSKNLQIITEQVAIIYGSLNLVTNKKEILSVIGIPWNIAKKQMKYKLSIPHQSAFSQTEIIKKLGKFKPYYKISGDYELTLRLLNKHDAYYIEKFVVAEMRIGGVSSNPQNSLLLLKEYKRAQEENLLYTFKIFGVLSWIRVYIKLALWKILGERLTRRVLDVGNRLLFRKSYWVKGGRG